MYSTTISMFFTFSLLFVFLHQASSLYCYACLSSAQHPCHLDPKRTLQIDCANRYVLLSKELVKSINSSFESPLSEPLKAKEYLDHGDYSIPDDETEFDCITVTLYKSDDKGEKHRGVLRGCMPKSVTCENWKLDVGSDDQSLEVQDWVRCDHHLCNQWSGSNYLNIGFLNFACPLLLIAIKM